ncbi:MAG: DUF2093 domain-containing protein [Hyphomicrobium zavarzinii]|jgi:hypothetical protein|uniref:DUF2093 domain-containing protein n=1 Tax=Hyphomicrobium TaxID=81 RepID=UPI000370AE8D|nr:MULTISPECIES: DUF2093 domain-containing protein [Hyphomicrobium]MBL8845132.1 DUF2093 domain-containing protein [Hyphomicrobium zavarzinii]WBT36343.1 DUF2093 domain-containing protein [Hyphomicrobium sp. DMF-1]HML43644.1 DUF2093 domain-containing protein [Hyphomicrobium zavarzinii]
MNRFDKLFGIRGEAQVRYLDGEFQVVSPGDFVRCAVTGQKIDLADLRYWSVELQEPYASSEISLQRYLESVRNRKAAG